jgi:septum formation protein
LDDTDAPSLSSFLVPFLVKALSQKPELKIYLASKSPRRQELLRQINVEFELLLPEDQAAAEALEATRLGESPSQYVTRVTLAKMAQAQDFRLQRALPERPILTADTTVALGGTIYGKPADIAEARSMLKQLQGKTHRVLTAVAVHQQGKTELRLSASRVRFARLDRDALEAYLASAEGLDKAGAYAVQGLAARFIRDIQGSYSGIMGLPLYETSLLLKL